TATPTTASACHRVVLGPNNFYPLTCTLNAGEEVEFENLFEVTYTIFTGVDQHFQPNADAPAPLNSARGVTLNTGDHQRFTFAKVGTFNITATCACSMSPPLHMNMTVTVMTS